MEWATTVGACCIADFEECQRPYDEDAQERSRDNALHQPRNAIYKILHVVFYFFDIIFKVIELYGKILGITLLISSWSKKHWATLLSNKFGSNGIKVLGL